MIALVAGALANKAGNGGNAWARLSWVCGLDELGVEAYFVEQLDGRPASGATAFFDAVMGEFWDPERAALIGPRGEIVAGGLSHDGLLEAAARCSVLLNLSGHLRREELRRPAACCVLVDDDPGYTQFWHAAGIAGGLLEGYDAHYTFGTRIGSDGCAVPGCGVRWRATRPPVVLSDWPVLAAERSGRVTTVASWRGPYGPVEHDGVVYGQRVHQLRRFSALPRLAGRELEIALAIDPSEDAAARQLRDDGWTVLDAATLTCDPASFRSYVQASDAELSVAQDIYVRTACGWFSDRTTRYLASGRPAIVQDTGFAAELPVGEGLLAFVTADEAIAALREVERNYDEHACAARAIAEQHFDAARVVGHILEEVL